MQKYFQCYFRLQNSIVANMRRDAREGGHIQLSDRTIRSSKVYSKLEKMRSKNRRNVLPKRRSETARLSVPVIVAHLLLSA